jgi:hypothetical protein
MVSRKTNRSDSEEKKKFIHFNIHNKMLAKNNRKIFKKE